MAMAWICSLCAFCYLSIYGQDSSFWLTLCVFVLSLMSTIKIGISNAGTAQAGEKDLWLPTIYDKYEGVVVDMDKKPHVKPEDFSSALRDHMSLWKIQEKKGVWIKLPINLAYLIESAVQQGFWYHHAEPSYLMLVNWLPRIPCTLPANASHRVGVGAVVLNDQREILVVQENSGCLRDMGVWKIPTGVVDEGEDIHVAVVREVKEETGIDTEFREILSFRQAHKAYFQKSDIFLVCLLNPLSFDIQRQQLEIEAAQWMPLDEFATQPTAREDGLFESIAELCTAKLQGDYAGFIRVPREMMICGQSNCFYRSV